MKTIPAGLAAHYALSSTRLATALRVEREDGQIFGFTSADKDETIASVLYEAFPGLLVTDIDLSAGMNVDNLEITTIDDGTVFSRSEVMGGVWRNAGFALFRYNWSSPSDGIDSLITGTFGEVYLKRNTVVAEMRGLQQYLQQTVGNPSTKLCRARFADFPTASSPETLCRLNPATFTVSATVTGVTSNQVFTASSLAQATDWFTEGIVTWTGGVNSPLRQKVKAHASGGVITLMLPMFQTISIGDTFDIIAGCTKRVSEDCGTKFSNVLNFQGEPHRPTTDDLTESPELSV